MTLTEHLLLWPWAARAHSRGRGGLRDQRSDDLRRSDRRFEAGSGDLVWLPRTVPHTFANLGDEPVWAFGSTTPAGLEGMFEEQSAYFATLLGPPDSDRVREIGARYGVQALGPPLQPD